ncbi:SpoIIE family protein phosphatase [Actinoplanes sp. NPDC051633]|uniref:ATP-binding SpoIIE family protein phosphatase n=1 Tax=Actinoplanes sp. NPDC051633 TaxID=3155670 RepID=UPI00342EF0B1
MDRFSLADAVATAADLRAVTRGTEGLDGAADAIVQRLFTRLVDGAGEPALRSVCLYIGCEARASAGSGAAPAEGSAAGSDTAPAEGSAAGSDTAGSVSFGDETFTVVLRPVTPVGAEVAANFEVVAAGVAAGLGRLSAEAYTAELERAVAGRAADIEHRLALLGAEADVVQRLQSVGRRLTAQLDLDVVVQEATDAATTVTGAAFGAFFYNLINDRGESYVLYTIAGVPKEAFSRFPMPRNTKVFAPTFEGEGVMRSDDITADPRYGHNEPYHGMPEGHLPVRSYLAVPVISPTSGGVLGGFFFGHPETARFTARHERLAEGVAGYTAIALDNAHLYARQRSMATELQRSMLPSVPEVAGFEVVSRYLPAATGSEVGGDWFDVIELPAGRTAFVIGDVMGRGVTAATTMGRIRTAVLSYARLDLPPATVLQHVSQMAGTMSGHQFVTCLYAVYDPTDSTLTYASAGHLPPAIIDADGRVSLPAERLGLPLRIGTDYRQRQIPFPPGSGLVLYTDGLIERRTRPLDDGLLELTDKLADLTAREPGDAEAGCDKLIDELTEGLYDDDIALLYVRDLGHRRHSAHMPLTETGDLAARARQFTRATLLEWRLGAMIDPVITVVTELVSNAIRHTGAPRRLDLLVTGARLVITVTDHDERLPRRTDPAPSDPRHRGLVIVDAYAHRWGNRPVEDGKAVWAEMTLPSA